VRGVGEAGDGSPEETAGWKPGGYIQALAMIAGGLDFLNVSADQIPETDLGGVLVELEASRSRMTAARAAVLNRFDAAGGHDSDGYQNSSSWLKDKAGMTRPAAKGRIKEMRTLRDRPLLTDAMAEGWLHDSYAADIIRWTKPLPAAEKTAADEILLGALNAGASLDDLHLLATAIVEKWKSTRPDPDGDPGDDGFDDRAVRLDTTMDGAGHLTGELTPTAAAALNAVLEALGKKRGPEDTRTGAQRYHDAVEEACQLLISAGMLPDRAGASTRADVRVSMNDLVQMEGAAVLEEAWLRAESGEPGWLTGDAARAAACDALIVPIVTAAPDWSVAAQMIFLILDTLHARGTDTDTDTDSAPGGTGHPAGVIPPAYRGGPPGSTGTDGGPIPFPPAVWDDLLYRLGKLAIQFVSGPGALASFLRTGLLPEPFNSKSVPIDIGYSETIPSAIRRGVIARAGGRCEWPGGCDRPASASDVHHIVHKQDGGPTSVTSCGLFCKFHHLVCIHRWGWKIELHTDGTVTAASPGGQVIEGRPPPGDHPRHGPPRGQAA
jgi:hypothetical protein